MLTNLNVAAGKVKRELFPAKFHGIHCVYLEIKYTDPSYFSAFFVPFFIHYQ